MDLKALHRLSYGLYVVGSKEGDRLNAQIANTVFQVASEPPTVVVSINKDNLSHQFIHQSRVFTASVLSKATPLPFIGRFGFKSGRDIDKLNGVDYKTGETGAPVVLENAVAYLEVALVNEVGVGTHTIFIGELKAAEVLTEEECLTYEYYHQVKRGTTPKAAPVYIAEQRR